MRSLSTKFFTKEDTRKEVVQEDNLRECTQDRGNSNEFTDITVDSHEFECRVLIVVACYPSQPHEVHGEEDTVQ